MCIIKKGTTYVFQTERTWYGTADPQKAMKSISDGKWLGK